MRTVPLMDRTTRTERSSGDSTRKVNRIGSPSWSICVFAYR